MDNAEKLQLINKEPNLQYRLACLVKNGFKQEATNLIWKLLYECMAMFWCEWQCTNFCSPLQRTSKTEPAIYVVIRTNGKEDYRMEPGDVIFELGWEKTILGWDENMSREMAHHIFSLALARPINQWSFHQAEGTARAARIFWESPGRKISAAHLLFHFRRADFCKMDELAYLSEFPAQATFQGDTDTLLVWMIEQFRAFGWEESRINKEFLEWMWLKLDINPCYFLSVAKLADLSKHGRKTVIRRYLQHNFTRMIECVHVQEKERKAYLELFRIANFGPRDHEWIYQELVNHLTTREDIGYTFHFMREWGKEVIAEHSIELSEVCKRAFNMATAANQYGRAARIVFCKNEGNTIGIYMWHVAKEKAEILGQTTK